MSSKRRIDGRQHYRAARLLSRPNAGGAFDSCALHDFPDTIKADLAAPALQGGAPQAQPSPARPARDQVPVTCTDEFPDLAFRGVRAEGSDAW